MKYEYKMGSRSSQAHGSKLAQVVEVKYKINLRNLNVYLNCTNTTLVTVIADNYTFTVSNYDVQDVVFNRVSNSLLKEKYDNICLIANGVRIDKLLSYTNLFNNHEIYMIRPESKLVQRDDNVTTKW